MSGLDKRCSHVPPRLSTGRKQRFAVSVILAALIFLAFSPALDGQFLSLDDQLYVTGNASVFSGISWSGTRWAFSAVYAGYWHPLTWLSYMADVELFGMNPRWFHFVNLFLHVVNSVLVMFVLANMTGAFWRSVAVSLLFAVHPLHVESVAWIAERKDMLFALFWLTTMGAYHRYSQRSSAGRYLVVIAIFALGLMTKPMIVTLPFVLLLLDFWPLGRIRLAGRRSDESPTVNAQFGKPIPVMRLILEKIPLLALSAMASWIAFAAQHKANAVGSLVKYPFSARLANAAISYLAYVRDTLWPWPLAVIYPHPLQGIVWWHAVGAGLLLAGISVALLLAARRKRPALAVGWFWFVGTLVPVIGLVQIGLQSRADRFTYVPLIGLGLMVAWGLFERDVVRRTRRVLLVSSAALVFVVLTVLTRIQVGYWHDDDTLLAHAIDSTSNNWPAHRFLAVSLEQRGRNEEAMVHVQEIERIKPDYLKGHAAFGISLPKSDEVPEADEKAMQENSLGVSLKEQGRLDEAIAAFGRAVRMSPGYATAHLNLANALGRTGRFDEALSEYREVLAIKPRHGLALNNMAGVLKRTGRTREAIRHFREAAEILPKNAEVHANFGWALFELGELEEALAEFHKAARINQRYTAEMAELADSLLAGGNVAGAQRWYRDALGLNPNDAAVKAKLDKTK